MINQKFDEYWSKKADEYKKNGSNELTLSYMKLAAFELYIDFHATFQESMKEFCDEMDKRECILYKPAKDFHKKF